MPSAPSSEPPVPSPRPRRPTQGHSDPRAPTPLLSEHDPDTHKHRWRSGTEPRRGGPDPGPSPHTEQVPPRCTMKDPRVRGAARLMIYDWVSGTEAPCVLDMLRQQAARAALKARGSWRNRRVPTRPRCHGGACCCRMADARPETSYVLPRACQGLDTAGT